MFLSLVRPDRISSPMTSTAAVMISGFVAIAAATSAGRPREHLARFAALTQAGGDRPSSGILPWPDPASLKEEADTAIAGAPANGDSGGCCRWPEACTDRLGTVRRRLGCR